MNAAPLALKVAVAVAVADELSAVRSNFYFVTFYFSASSSTCFSCDV